MKVPVGHIFPKGTVIGLDATGQRWLVDIEVKTKKIKAILTSKHVPGSIKIMRNTKLTNLVVVKHAKYPHVALDGYMKELVAYYYQTNAYQVIKKRVEWEPWHKRWEKECAEDFKDNFTLEELKGVNDYKFLSAYTLKGKDYVLPIFGYKDISSLSGKPLFYPDTFYKKSRTPRCIYKAEDTGNFPFIYNAVINGINENGTNVNKKVVVFLHGFTSPPKWHYGVWQHVFGHGNLLSEEEKLWKTLWKQAVQDPKDQAIFEKCKLNQDGDSCDEAYCIENLLFKTIHGNIKDSCKKYLVQIVTFFNATSTISMKAFNKPNDNCKVLKIYCINQSSGIYSKTVFYGRSHNWDDNAPVLHLFPVTMYLSSKWPGLHINFDSYPLTFNGFLKIA